MTSAASGANGDVKQDASEEPRQLEAIQALAAALQKPPPESHDGYPTGMEEFDSRGLFDDPASLERYLRARQWDVPRAEEAIRETAVWRRQFDFWALREGSKYASAITAQNASGKMYTRGFDRKGRPVIMMKPALETHESDEAMLKHLVYNMERALACCKASSVVKICMVVDFIGAGLSHMPSLSMAKQVVTIMQEHYPERLGQAFVLNSPWIMSTFFDTVSPFLDPVTHEKFQFVSEEGEERSRRMAEHFDLQTLEASLGGTLTVPFDSKIYLQVKPADAPDVFGVDFNAQVVLAAAA